ncbi:hypothetical protein M433DRAFT_157273 [Acidomyces richmondensis BFW]|nr:MAG: hypothetical protein FE78DRAFT_91784 [Acidomyces sp. 'richmondensis']KYG42969.1 hypothetical protein M433DRAFT_157273 [Acidomyces richmondensis BFW]
MSLSDVVFLVFAKADLSVDQWQILTSDIADVTLPKALNADEVAVENVRHRFLEPNRVMEIRLSLRRPPLRLSDCSKVCQNTEFVLLQDHYHIEIVVQPGDLYELHRFPGLAVFDMDSTLIQQEVIDELARAVGLYDKVAAITEAAMRGEAPYTDFESSLRARVALLNGVPTSIWDRLRTGTITFTPGAKCLVHALKKLGWKTAVLSGGFMPLANWAKEALGLDHAFANHLVSDDERKILTGELVPGAPIVHAERKRELLLQLAAEHAIPVEMTAAVGDGSNDLSMMHEAGLGLAFNAKPKVQHAAPARLNSPSLLDVMYVLGYTKGEVDALLVREPHPCSPSSNLRNSPAL